ncbi:MAG TPA: hypothetical protein VNP73_02185, partial [Actinomycetota bacterium]|nr:hypothetical protein [Actinomycetota bacterium]
PAVCSAFSPGATGSGKPTVVVTDTATEQQPVIQKVNLAESISDLDVIPTGLLPPPTDAFNIQVDSANPSAGLHVLFEFPTRRDYDLELLWPDDSYAARSHDFNLVYSPAGIHENGGHAGVATDASEHIVGVATPDCGGYTVETVNWLGEGGEMEVKVWLGTADNVPQAPGAEPHA